MFEVVQRFNLTYNYDYYDNCFILTEEDNWCDCNDRDISKCKCIKKIRKKKKKKMKAKLIET